MPRKAKLQQIEYYQSQLRENLYKLKHIRKILEKLSPKAFASPKKIEFVRIKSSSKRKYQRIDWPLFVTNQIREKKKLFSVDSLTSVAMEVNGISKNNRPNTKKNIQKAIEQLGARLKPLNDGKNIYYGRQEWFNGNDLKKVFRNRFDKSHQTF